MILTAITRPSFVEASNAQGALRRAAIWTWRLRAGRAVHLKVTDLGPAHPARG